ncbi:adenylate/guanylate cyclase domain-containing protein [Echinicola sp. CAU 1574]|uniref:Adenylate/guanylate cyclase domain-containing protein n=1 Tax=Echinicola arenosa TaxID=2774144 RepID=A0ABR9AH67_9BACT|nr:adenylate/guanylate cyclase domain-containing protein [Echinicola arenosa]MBD8488190.1 adenylate/guanylate cyclase domain-containing protein [Echinicola arenosa]
MKFRNKRKWAIKRQYILGWCLAFIFLSIVRGEGTEELGSVKFELGKAIWVSLIGGMIFGALSGFAQILTEKHGYMKMSLQGLLAARLGYVILFLWAMVSLAYWIFGEEISYLEFAFEPGSFAIYFYIVVVDGLMFALRQVQLYFGGDNLWQLFRGKFYTPREVERIFMFLDLQSSTTHAERLGHIQYSKLIQDCFNDLGIVAENDAEIYQYVGDEAILFWKLEDGLKYQNCLKAFFNFKQQLATKQDYYHRQYGCLPHFKAGLHAGVVTMTEVGKFKKEIAFHGDTINTAARIQGQCNVLGQELLISSLLKQDLETNTFHFEQMGSIPLKGKEAPLILYAVSPS